MGHPPIRDHQLKMRVTKQERDMLQALAQRQGLTLTEAFRLGLAKALLLPSDTAEEATSA